MMKLKSKIRNASILLMLWPAALFAKNIELGTSTCSFIKNVGQVTDENHKSRTDIDYRIATPGLSVFISSGGLQYQWRREEKNQRRAFADEKKIPPPGALTLYAMQVTLVGANKNVAPTALEEQPYYENYFLPYCNGKTAHSYHRIVYKNIYPDIDWVLYTDGKNAAAFKYDFVVHDGGHASDIKIRYEGAEQIAMSGGAVRIITPMGEVTEQKPFTYDAKTRKEISSSYVLKDNVISFAVAKQNDIVIDPTLNWGSYFTNPSHNFVTCNAADTLGNAYVCGVTDDQNAYIATFNAPSQYHYYSGNPYDGFIAKFNSTGDYVSWASYYGGEGEDQITAAVCDNSGNLFITGYTTSFKNIAGGGAQQDSNGATRYMSVSNPQDAFLAKFNKYGGFDWGTYIGGHGTEYGNALANDAAGNLYVAGSSNGPDSLATSGAFQSSAGAGCGFLGKYSGLTGKRMWGTFFNGVVLGVAVANNNSVYIDGYTNYFTGVATPGTYQPAFGTGPINGFLVRFNATNGARIKGTYYGSYMQALGCDSMYNIYSGGRDVSSAGVVAKFDSTCNLQWAKGYPGVIFNNMALTPNNKIYFAGVTNGGTGATMPGALHYTKVTSPPPLSYNKTSMAVVQDNFLAKMDNDGRLLYGTYYGGADVESNGTVCYGLTSGVGKVYLAGSTFSYSDISTPNGFQKDKIDTNGQTGYLAQFQDDTNVFIRFPYIDTQLCVGGSFSITYGVTDTFKAGNVFKVQLSDAGGSFASPVTLGNITASYQGVIACQIPLGTTPGTGYRVRLVSSLPADTFYNYDMPVRISSYHKPEGFAPLPICANLNLTMIDTSSDPVPPDVKYTWISPNPNRLNGTFATYFINSLTLADSGDYIVIADNHGCVKRDTFHVHITVAPPEPTVTGDTSLCIGDTLNLAASSPVSGVQFGWFNPADSFLGYQPNITWPNITLGDAGKYRVSAILDGCQSNVLFGQIITVHPLPLPSANNNGPICAGDTLRLTASDTLTGVKYSWSGPNGFTSSNKDTSIIQSSTNNNGQYTVQTTSPHGCTNKAVTNALIKPQPSDIDAQSNSPVCSGLQLELIAANATVNASYSWTGPNGYASGTQNPVVSNTALNMQGVYKVTVDLNGCRKTDSTTVIILQSPDTPKLSSNSPLITGQVLKLNVMNVQSGMGYLWQGPGGFTSQSVNPVINSVTPAMSGVYKAIVSSGKCIAQDTIVVVITDAQGPKTTEPVIIFPNPNNGIFRITGETGTDAVVEIAVFASDGKLIYKTTLTPVNKKIDETINIGAVANGVYRLKVRMNGKPTTVSFTVKQ